MRQKQRGNMPISPTKVTISPKRPISIDLFGPKKSDFSVAFEYSVCGPARRIVHKTILLKHLLATSVTLLWCLGSFLGPLEPTGALRHFTSFQCEDNTEPVGGLRAWRQYGVNWSVATIHCLSNWKQFEANSSVTTIHIFWMELQDGEGPTGPLRQCNACELGDKPGADWGVTIFHLFSTWREFGRKLEHYDN